MAKKAAPLLPAALKRAEFGRSVYSVTLPEGVTATDVADSDFWINLAPKLEALDHIEAVTADNETYVEMLVSRVEKISDGNRTVRIPKLVVLHKVALGSLSKEAKKSAEDAADAPGFVPPVEDDSVRNQQTNRVLTGETEVTDEDGDGVPDGYKVTYGGPSHKHRVTKDGVTDPLATGLTKKEAIAWANEHAKKSA